MIFNVKVAFNREIARIANLTNIYGGNPRSDHVQI